GTHSPAARLKLGGTGASSERAPRACKQGRGARIVVRRLDPCNSNRGWFRQTAHLPLAILRASDYEHDSGLELCESVCGEAGSGSSCQPPSVGSLQERCLQRRVRGGGSCAG